MIGAGAIVVGDAGGAGEPLLATAAECGFVFVRHYDDQIPLGELVVGAVLSFFLFAEADDPRDHAPLIGEIRRNPARELAYAPLAYFTYNGSEDLIDTCVGLGFDEVIGMPLTRDRLKAGLMRQIETPQVYYETAEYFGPDRRRLSKPRLADAFLRGLSGVQAARRIEFRRSVTTGIAILGDSLKGGSGARST